MVTERAVRQIEVWYLDAQDAKQHIVVSGVRGSYEIDDGVVKIYQGGRTTIIPVSRLILIEEHGE